jgi:hypothetical protein
MKATATSNMQRLATQYASGGTTVNFTYSPALSMASEREAYEKIAPVVAEVVRRENRRSG